MQRVAAVMRVGVAVEFSPLRRRLLFGDGALDVVVIEDIDSTRRSWTTVVNSAMFVTDTTKSSGV